MKRLVLVAIAAMLVLLSVVSFAEEGIEPYASLYFDSYSANITPKAGGRLNVNFSTTGIEDSYSLGVASFQLQKKVNGVFQDAGAEQSGSLGRNVIEHSFTRTCHVVPGEVYRVKVLFVCDNSHGFKSQTYYSSSAKAID